MRVWWGITWRTVLLSVVIGATLGFISGILILITGSDANPGFVAGLLGQLGSIPASIIVVHWVLRHGLRGLHVHVTRT